MNPDRKHDIFLSYARKDAALMERVRANLKAQRLSVWTDAHIPAGSPDWEIEIENAMDSAGCVVVIMTPNIRAAGGVRSEVKYALNHGFPVITLLAAGDSRTSVIWNLARINWIDVRDNFDEGIAKAASTVRRALAGESIDEELSLIVDARPLNPREKIVKGQIDAYLQQLEEADEQLTSNIEKLEQLTREVDDPIAAQEFLAETAQYLTNLKEMLPKPQEFVETATQAQYGHSEIESALFTLKAQIADIRVLLMQLPNEIEAKRAIVNKRLAEEQQLDTLRNQLSDHQSTVGSLSRRLKTVEANPVKDNGLDPTPYRENLSQTKQIRETLATNARAIDTLARTCADHLLQTDYSEIYKTRIRALQDAELRKLQNDAGEIVQRIKAEEQRSQAMIERIRQQREEREAAGLDEIETRLATRQTTLSSIQQMVKALERAIFERAALPTTLAELRAKLSALKGDIQRTDDDYLLLATTDNLRNIERRKQIVQTIRRLQADVENTAMRIGQLERDQERLDKEDHEARALIKIGEQLETYSQEIAAVEARISDHQQAVYNRQLSSAAIDVLYEQINTLRIKVDRVDADYLAIPKTDNAANSERSSALWVTLNQLKADVKALQGDVDHIAGEDKRLQREEQERIKLRSIAERLSPLITEAQAFAAELTPLQAQVAAGRIPDVALDPFSQRWHDIEDQQAQYKQTYDAIPTTNNAENNAKRVDIRHQFNTINDALKQANVTLMQIETGVYDLREAEQKREVDKFEADVEALAKRVKDAEAAFDNLQRSVSSQDSRALKTLDGLAEQLSTLGQEYVGLTVDAQRITPALFPYDGLYTRFNAVRTRLEAASIQHERLTRDLTAERSQRGTVVEEVAEVKAFIQQVEAVKKALDDLEAGYMRLSHQNLTASAYVSELKSLGKTLEQTQKNWQTAHTAGYKLSSRSFALDHWRKEYEDSHALLTSLKPRFDFKSTLTEQIHIVQQAPIRLHAADPRDWLRLMVWKHLGRENVHNHKKRFGEHSLVPIEAVVGSTLLALTYAILAPFVAEMIESWMGTTPPDGTTSNWLPVLLIATGLLWLANIWGALRNERYFQADFDVQSGSSFAKDLEWRVNYRFKSEEERKATAEKEGRTITTQSREEIYQNLRFSIPYRLAGGAVLLSWAGLSFVLGSLYTLTLSNHFVQSISSTGLQALLDLVVSVLVGIGAGVLVFFIAVIVAIPFYLIVTEDLTPDGKRDYIYALPTAIALSTMLIFLLTRAWMLSLGTNENVTFVFFVTIPLYMFLGYLFYVTLKNPHSSPVSAIMLFLLPLSHLACIWFFLLDGWMLFVP